MSYGHSARLRLEGDGMSLRLIVKDEDPGIPPTEFERITEPYYRPDASRSRKTGGVGLGLYIGKAIALMHGGELLLANRAQGGFSASLLLPPMPVILRRRDLP